MLVTEQPVFSAPFDAVAARYDASFTSSRIGLAQRAAVWNQLAKVFRPGDRILEIGCGTGVDACFLAERGVRVVAFDNSAQMIQVAAQRVRGRRLEKLIQTRVLRAEDMGTLSTGELFDGVFSNFGALNCIEDLQQLAGDLTGLLKPGAMALLCWMGPYCLWEMIWYLAHGNRNKAFRRFNRNGVSARIADGAAVQVHYPSVRFLARAFAPHFRLNSVQGIGVAVPPSYVEPWADHYPRLLRRCERVDSWLGRCPGMRLLGDHVLVRLQRENTGGQ